MGGGGLVLLALAAASALSLAGVLVLLLRQAGRLGLDQELRALPRPADLQALPLLSVVVPLRDEARNVGPLLRALLALDHPRYEVLLADDGSTDGTAELARAAAGGDPRVTLLDVPALARDERAGWRSGKAWVLAQAARAARGEWLLFVDADTRQRPDAAWRALELCRRHGLQAFSSAGVYPNPGLLGELLEGTLLLPLFLSVPLARTNDPADRSMGWANGQFVLVRRDTYERLGGHGAVREFWVEDLALGRLFKRAGVPYRYCPDGRLFECVNYVGWGEAHRGWARLVGSAAPWLGLGRGWFAAVAALLLLGGLLPLPLCALAWSGPWGEAALGPVSARALASVAAGLALLLQGAVRASGGKPVWRALLLPLGAGLCLGALASAWRIHTGAAGFLWRGRPLTPDDPARVQVLGEGGPGAGT